MAGFVSSLVVVLVYVAVQKMMRFVEVRFRSVNEICDNHSAKPNKVHCGVAGRPDAGSPS
jgi:hypothetical protein